MDDRANTIAGWVLAGGIARHIDKFPIYEFVIAGKRSGKQLEFVYRDAGGDGHKTILQDAI